MCDLRLPQHNGPGGSSACGSGRARTRTQVYLLGILVVVFGLCSGPLSALQPPTPEQVKDYVAKGTLEEHAAAARRRGNHEVKPRLVWNLRRSLLKAAGKSEDEIDSTVNAPPPDWQGGLPAQGTPKVLVMLVDFAEYPHAANQTPEDVANKFFANGDSGQAPYESLRNFYQRSSYSQLTITGNVLGWYRAQQSRSYYQNLGDGPGQERLMMEAIDYFDAQSHDFTQYDNDNDGTIDAFFIKWTGPDNGWANFWWAYQWEWHSYPSYTVDGKSMGSYVWSWISNPVGGVYQPRVDIHETGHLLGLPDLYDYNSSVGPQGGVGDLDMMDANWGDHNCFSKFMLEWLTPTTVSSGSQVLTLAPSGTSTNCVLIMPGAVPGTIFDEFFMIQYRRRSTGNDPSNYPTDGYVIWHIDSTLDGSGTDFLYDNSYTAHKLVRLMEADGLEEIEQNSSADAGDFYLPPKVFGNATTPNSKDYAGTATGVQVDQLTSPGASMSGQFGVVTQPIIGADGAALIDENCGAGNGAIDPDETVTVNFSLKNVGTGSTTNLVATLQATGGVTSPSGPQTYGALTVGGPAVARSYAFVASGTCGGTVTATFTLQDGTTDLGTVAFTLRLGVLSNGISESFDQVLAPSLPAGWVATVASGTISPWATSSAASDSQPNSVFSSDPSSIADNRLDSSIISLASGISQLTFRHSHSLETGYDGGVLEIAIGAGAFTDILAAGGSFVSGGYTHTISSCCSNPLSGRQAWSGSSSGFITTTVNLPASAANRSVKLRWRVGTDYSVSATGWYVDTVSIPGPYVCCSDFYPVGDFDQDNDVDQADFGHLEACLSGSGIRQDDPDCQDAKLDTDYDVDEQDVGIFLSHVSGAETPAE